MVQTGREQQFIQRGLELYGRRLYSEALDSYKKVASNSPLYAISLHLQALVKRDLGDVVQAIALLERAIKLKPLLEMRVDLGGLYLASGEFSAAIKCFSDALATKGDDWRIHRAMGRALHGAGRHAEAIEHYEQALKLSPHQAELYQLKSWPLFMMERFSDALQCNLEAEQRGIRDANLLNDRAAMQIALQDYEGARIAAVAALQLNAQLPHAWFNLGRALRKLGDSAGALKSLHTALNLKLQIKEVYFELGLTASGLNMYEEALEYYDKALVMDGSDLDTLCNRAACLQKMEKLDLAEDEFRKICALDPGYAIAANNLGVIYMYKKEYARAKEQFARALEVDPGYSDALLNMAVVLVPLGDVEEAKEYSERAWKLAPDRPQLLGKLLDSKLRLAEWRDWDVLADALAEQIRNGQRSAVPLTGLALFADAGLQLRCSQLAVERYRVEPCTLSAATRVGKKIRVGYFSANFYEHSVMRLMVDIFEKHDRDRFEVVGISYDYPKNDAMHQRVLNALDAYHDLDGISDIAAVRLCRELELDIAVDLVGYTARSRELIFLNRVAPVQVNYLGFPGTLAGSSWDYLIADQVVVPRENTSFYGEKMIWMPGSFQANRAEIEASSRRYTRAEVGLPEQGFVFCNFNGVYKLLPSVFQLWMQLLKRVPGSVLWMNCEQEAARKNLRAEAERRGIDSGRLIFAGHIGLAEHLARMQVADLFLDTMPFNAGANASVTLRTGLPVLTCAGQPFAARMGASLLSALGLAELITTSHEEYLERAVQIATTPGMIDAIKTKLRNQLGSSDLFDSSLMTERLEAAYLAMVERSRNGLAPAHITI